MCLRILRKLTIFTANGGCMGRDGNQKTTQTWKEKKKINLVAEGGGRNEFALCLSYRLGGGKGLIGPKGSGFRPSWPSLR